MTGSVAVLSLISLQALVCAAPSLPVSPAADQPSTIPIWAVVPLVVILAAIVISMMLHSEFRQVRQALHKLIM